MMVILDGSQQHERAATTLSFENDKSRSRSPGSMTRSTRVQDIAQQINQTCENQLNTETRNVFPTRN